MAELALLQSRLVADDAPEHRIFRIKRHKCDVDVGGFVRWSSDVGVAFYNSRFVYFPYWDDAEILPVRREMEIDGFALGEECFKFHLRDDWGIIFAHVIAPADAAAREMWSWPWIRRRIHRERRPQRLRERVAGQLALRAKGVPQDVVEIVCQFV